ncbi:hypothetical protein J537_2419 [Acinetobacter baumannii 1437282]|nr:hypothetical protein J537_2419 [Acinetobacter baumannii 1437282]
MWRVWWLEPIRMNVGSWNLAEVIHNFIGLSLVYTLKE